MKTEKNLKEVTIGHNRGVEDFMDGIIADLSGKSEDYIEGYHQGQEIAAEKFPSTLVEDILDADNLRKYNY